MPSHWMTPYLNTIIHSSPRPTAPNISLIQVAIVSSSTIRSYYQTSPSSGNVKGVGGSPALIRGYGNHTLLLTSDRGLRDSITIPNAVYVPTSPYNLILPQLLVGMLKQLVVMFLGSNTMIRDTFLNTPFATLTKQSALSTSS